MDRRFGRCNYFILFDDKNEQIKSIINSAASAASDAGPIAVKELTKHNIKVVITGSVGEIAKESLQTAGIEIITIKTFSVQEAIDLYLKSKRESFKFGL